MHVPFIRNGMKTNYAEHEEDWTFWFEVKDS